MDNFFIEAVTLEIGERLAGARIDKVHQPEPELLLMRLWNGREELRLLLGATGGKGRLHLTEGAWNNPFTPPRFCQLLRSRLTRILSVEKSPDERIVHLRCRGREGGNYLLIAELLGMQSNLLLVDGEGKIIDALKRNAGGREAVPGRPYIPPSSTARLPLAGELPEIPLGSAEPAVFKRFLMTNLAPMSPLVASELAAAVAAGVTPREALAGFRRCWLAREFRPSVGILRGKPVLSAFPLPHLDLDQVEEFTSPSHAADRFYSEFSAPGKDSERSVLAGSIRRALQRLEARRQKISAELQEPEAAENGRRYGELLLANLYRLRRGMTEVPLEDFTVEPPVLVTVALDPCLSPQENAERYFRSYKKKKKGVEHAARRLAETGEEIAWLEEMTHYLEEAENREDLQEIRQELVEAGVVPAASRKAPRNRTPEVRNTLRRALTPGGFQLWWGKNSRTNDYVSRELTGPDDLWFHAHRQPGCHLVLKRGGGGEVPKEDQLFAAAMAAGYSRGRDEGKMEVMVTEGKWIHKPKGGHPGLVTVERYRTMVVVPRRAVDESCKR